MIGRRLPRLPIRPIGLARAGAGPGRAGVVAGPALRSRCGGYNKEGVTDATAGVGRGERRGGGAGSDGEGMGSAWGRPELSSALEPAPGPVWRGGSDRILCDPIFEEPGGPPTRSISEPDNWVTLYMLLGVAAAAASAGNRRAGAWAGGRQ